MARTVALSEHPNQSTLTKCKGLLAERVNGVLSEGNKSLRPLAQRNSPSYSIVRFQIF